MSSRRPSWLLIAIAGVVLAGGALLAWKLSAPAGDPSATNARATTARAGSPNAKRHVPPIPVRTRPHPSDDEPDDGDTTASDNANADAENGPKTPRVMPTVLADVHQQLKLAARPCIEDRDLSGKLEQELRVTYKLVMGNDTASVNDVTKVKSDLDDPALESCILERLEAIELRKTGVPTAEKLLFASLKLGDL